jgi:predicted acylesterase/phospholipase RssA
MKVGLVLSGGGAKGAFEVGVLEVLLPYLERQGDELVAISGTSIGAFNGAFVASGQFDLLKSIWNRWDKHSCELVRPPFGTPLLSLVTHGYLFSTPTEFIDANLNTLKLANSKIKYINTAVRLADGYTRLGGNQYVKNNQLLVDEIAASMAPVPVTPSVQLDGQEYVDGGFRDTMPVKALIENATVEKVIAISVNPEKRTWNPELAKGTKGSFFSKIDFAFNDILWNEALRNDIAAGKEKMPKDGSYIVVYPERAITTGADFTASKLQMCMQHGREVAQQMFKG